MNTLNKEKILTGTVNKQLSSQYDALKESYTEENAGKYKTFYENLDLSDILDNSEYIFKEPYYGCNFYKNILKFIPPSRCASEYKKVKRFRDELPGLHASPKQIALYDDLNNEFTNHIGRNKNAIELACHMKHDPDFREKDLYNCLYKYSKCGEDEKCGIRDSIDEILKTCDKPYRFFIYVPRVCRDMNDCYGLKMHLDKFFNPHKMRDMGEEDYKKSMKCKFLASTLGKDPDYQDCIKGIGDIRLRSVMENLCSSDPGKEYKDIYVEHVIGFDPDYTSPEDAIDRIINDNYAYAMMEDAFGREYERRRTQQHIVDEMMLETALECFEERDLDEPFMENSISGYGMTIREVMEEYMEKEYEYETMMTEGVIKRPKKKFLDRVEEKGMAMDRKVRTGIANSQRQGNRVTRAVKAVVSAPATVMNTIKNGINEWKNTKDEKKKELMAQPGYRSKWFKNFKLAVLYGGSASISLTLVPIVAMCRHFSKEKNRRLRSEFETELRTEIKVLEEKINDANAEGNKQEKYQLMRTKDQLEQELTRVVLNAGRI